MDQMRKLVNKTTGMNVAHDLTKENPTEVKEWIPTGSRWLDSIVCRGKMAGVPVGKVLATLMGVGLQVGLNINSVLDLEAAELVATTFHEAFPEEGEPPAGDPETWLLAAIELAHSRVTALSTGSSRPPASTVVGLLVERATQAVWRFHVGDSRIYVRLSDGTMEPWTRDHNIINGLIDRSKLELVDGAGAPDEQPVTRARVRGRIQIKPSAI